MADARVELSLSMTTMEMGENKVALTEKAPGTYIGKAVFSMAGPWVVEVRVTKNGQAALERFHYTAK